MTGHYKMPFNSLEFLVDFLLCNPSNLYYFFVSCFFVGEILLEKGICSLHLLHYLLGNCYFFVKILEVDLYTFL